MNNVSAYKLIYHHKIMYFYQKKREKLICGSKNLSFWVGPQAPFTNKNTSEEEKMLRETL